MKNKEKIKEPFDPENTPKPPQVTNPVSRVNEEDAGENQAKKKKGRLSQDKPEKKPKLLGESETEIDDETTI